MTNTVLELTLSMAILNFCYTILSSSCNFCTFCFNKIFFISVFFVPWSALLPCKSWPYSPQHPTSYFGLDRYSAYAAIQSLLPYRGAVVASEDDTYSVSLYAPKEITERAEATVSDSSVLSIGLNGDKAVENQTVSVYNYTIRSADFGRYLHFDCQLGLLLQSAI